MLRYSLLTSVCLQTADQSSSFVFYEIMAVSCVWKRGQAIASIEKVVLKNKKGT